MSKRTSPAPALQPTDTVLSRLVDLGVEYKQIAGYVWRAKNGQELTYEDEALNILVMRIVNEEFAQQWAHGLLSVPVKDLLGVASPTS